MKKICHKKKEKNCLAYAFVVYLFLRDGKYKNFCAKKRAQRNAPKTAKKMNMCKNLLHTLKNPQRLRRPQRRRTANGSPADKNWTLDGSSHAVGANAARKHTLTSGGRRTKYKKTKTGAGWGTKNSKEKTTIKKKKT